jgi:hypothetical protein
MIPFFSQEFLFLETISFLELWIPSSKCERSFPKKKKMVNAEVRATH